MSNGTAVTAGLFKALPYDTVADFTPISTLAVFDTAVLVPADSPHRTLPQLLAHARTHAGQLNIGSVQIGSTQNLAAELFKSSAGIDAQVVPFNGTPALITALRGRQVDAAVEILGPALPQVRAGALRVLAVASEQRSAALPEVPTALEAGVAGFVASSWNALAAPARTPRAVVDRLQREVAAAVATPAVQQQLRALNAQPRTSTPEQAAALLQADIARWRAVIERAGIPRQ
jgi:tripartite-type tricarboxylate transporter receptor subunit TctC